MEIVVVGFIESYRWGEFGGLRLGGGGGGDGDSCECVR